MVITGVDVPRCGTLFAEGGGGANKGMNGEGSSRRGGKPMVQEFMGKRWGREEGWRKRWGSEEEWEGERERSM
ncbi:unnamed protein product, partial [Closterium sp. Naga37s-1]